MLSCFLISYRLLFSCPMNHVMDNMAEVVLQNQLQITLGRFTNSTTKGNWISSSKDTRSWIPSCFEKMFISASAAAEVFLLDTFATLLRYCSPLREWWLRLFWRQEIFFINFHKVSQYNLSSSCSIWYERNQVEGTNWRTKKQWKKEQGQWHLVILFTAKF